MVTGLKGLKARLLEVEQYLQLVLAGKLPVNHDIMYQLQARISTRRPLHFRAVLSHNAALLGRVICSVLACLFKCKICLSAYEDWKRTVPSYRVD